MTRITNPLPIFLDARGALSDGGYIYVGMPGADPQASPLQVYWDQGCTIQAAQPLRTMGGSVVNGATPANFFVNQPSYSLRILGSDGSLVFYAASAISDLTGLQPKDDDLTAIANQGTTPFGVALLLLKDQTALQNAVGLPDPLPKAGGTMAGDIKRTAAGTYVYWADPAMTSGRQFFSQTGAPDATSQPGDIQFFGS